MKETSGVLRSAPWVVGLAGLALMIGGWKLTTYVPTPSESKARRQERQEERLRQVREIADQAARRGDPGAAQLADKLHQFTPPAPQPQYRMQGSLVVVVGLALFILAGVLMYRHRPAPDQPAEDEP
jgi:hypothetical protein